MTETLLLIPLAYVYFFPQYGYLLLFVLLGWVEKKYT